jgi:hypothetical protein
MYISNQYHEILIEIEKSIKIYANFKGKRINIYLNWDYYQKNNSIHEIIKKSLSF